jgi:fructose-1,6-bisphosphatase
MDIEALLNPEGKGQSQTMDESTDEEIYQVIMDAVDAHENIDNNAPVATIVMHHLL